MPVNDELSIRIDVVDEQGVRDRLRWAAETIASLRDEVEALRAALAAQPQPLTPSTLEAAINCTEALTNDRREPERYREWYAEALAELRAATGSVPPTHAAQSQLVQVGWFEDPEQATISLRYHQSFPNSDPSLPNRVPIFVRQSDLDVAGSVTPTEDGG